MTHRFRLLAITLLTVVATAVGLALTAPAARALPADFTVTTDDPSTSELNDIIEFLVATPASDEAKARNLEGGMDAVVVPKTVYNLGLFRAPRGSHEITEITGRSGDTISATLKASSAGRPSVNTTIEFKKIDGNWRLANNSICRGVKTVGLNIYCNA
ncbi:hypothetical protein [Gordonia sp. FQ]|uniref:hypothetical protein n=1 Tax=Gordonia sp. FQ TaxID=3446634 RepID=UPI003F829E51